MNTEIIELTEEEVLAIAGGGDIDPPVSSSAAVDYPIIDNNPP